MDFRSIQLHVFTIVTVVKLMLVTNVSTGCQGRDGSHDVCEYSPPEITPSRVVVKYGDTFSVTCSIKEEANIDQFNWEISQGHRQQHNGTVIDLTVKNTTSWEMAPICYFTNNQCQCDGRLDVTLYQPPDSVSISYSNHSGPMEKGGQYELECEVKNIAPVRNLTVTFYRGKEVIGTAPPSADAAKEPVSHNFTLEITAREEDNGAQYWCEAMLTLGEEGPHPPPVVGSQNLTATVHYKPTIAYVSNIVSVTEGDTVHLRCSSTGNPAPQYKWSLPPSVDHMSDDDTLIIHNVAMSQSGNYTCRATNIKGQDRMIFIVDIKVDLLPIFAGLAAVGVLLLLAVCYFVYYTHYRHNHIGHYKLTDVFRIGNNNHVAQDNGI